VSKKLFTLTYVAAFFVLVFQIFTALYNNKLYECYGLWDATPCSLQDIHQFIFNVYGSVLRNDILVYNSNEMHKSQNLFNLTTALRLLKMGDSDA
jgi:hypothetical protein